MHLHYSQIMNIPCKDNVNNENVRIKVLSQTLDLGQEQKFRLFRHISRPSGSSGRSERKRRKVKQKKRPEDDIVGLC